MGNVSADGRYLWLSGRYDNEVYRFDTSDGSVVRVKVGANRTGSPSGRSRGATAWANRQSALTTLPRVGYDAF